MKRYYHTPVRRRHNYRAIGVRPMTALKDQRAVCRFSGAPLSAPAELRFFTETSQQMQTPSAFPDSVRQTKTDK